MIQTPLLLLLLTGACVGGDRGDPDLAEDTSYPGFPELLAVSGHCDAAGAFVVRARTIGWSERGWVQIWTGRDLSADPVVNQEIVSVGFRSDEYCDVLEGVIEGTQPCVGDFLEGYTALVAVSFEAGCAGMQAFGLGAEDVASGGTAAWPSGIEGDCEAPADTGPALTADVLELVPYCDEPL
jgi:hypothetical protein